jgi:hypothetical protein
MSFTLWLPLFSLRRPSTLLETPLRPPIHTITLQANVEDCLRKADTYENVDVLLKHLPAHKKADHLLFRREVVTEQKDYNETPEHRKKGQALKTYVSFLSAKYGRQLASLAEFERIVTQEERRKLRLLENDFYDKIKDYMDRADKQLASTKVELEIPDALGVLLLNFDTISGIIPEIIKKRVFRCFFGLGEKQHQHIDFVIASYAMKDAAINGCCDCNQSLLSDAANSKQLEYSRAILDLLKANASGIRTRQTNPQRFHIQPLKANDIFEEPPLRNQQRSGGGKK